jgi:rhodanese-related sulfurtransferase
MHVTTINELLETANASVPRITPAEARVRLSQESALLVDVRDAPEIAATGLIPGTIHVPRGMIEFRADPASPHHDARFAKDRPTILYCASGGRSALAARTLQDMGFRAVFNLGGLGQWTAAAGETEPLVQP